ncbi:MAG: hypothetical protein PHY54_12760 [Methylococcales bacterium]|nr:hypothetical protein [Methylococcales bacterium]
MGNPCSNDVVLRGSVVNFSTQTQKDCMELTAVKGKIPALTALIFFEYAIPTHYYKNIMFFKLLSIAKV